MEQIVSIIARDTSAPVLSVGDAKKQLDVTFDDDDTIIQQHIDAAVSYVENYTNRFLQPVTIDLYVDKLPNRAFLLPYGPVTAVNSVLVDGVAVAGFRTVPGSQYAVLPPAGALWPFTAIGMGGIVLNYSVGYAADTVPPALLAAIYQILSILYDKPVGPELQSQWDAVNNVLSPLKLRSV